MDWTHYQEAFSWDGSLRDIYVRHVTIEDWQCVLDFLRASSYDLEFTGDGESRPLPDRVAAIFTQASEESTALLIDGPHLALRCHFFTPEEIEFDLDPRDIDSEQRFNRLLEFLRALARLLNKEVILTPENLSDCPWLRIDPVRGVEEWFVDAT